MDKNTKNGSGTSGDSNQATNTSMNKTHVIVAFIVGLAIGTIGSPQIFGDRADDYTDEVKEEVKGEGEMVDEKPVEDENVLEETTTVAPDGNMITVRDQLAGDRVLIDEVELTVSGWVVVHEELGVGELGNALGAQRFDAGTHERGYVKLLRDTEIDKNYFVVLYADDGDSKFNLENDMKISEGDGETITSTFKTIIVDRKTN